MLIQDVNEEEFKVFSNISKENWERANVTWDIIREIGIDHSKHSEHLTEAAAFFAKLLQKCENVHSVRWRVKNPFHVMEKVVRKRAEMVEKYQEINPDNYFNVITDLVGVRVLHLFKSEWEPIHSFITNNWKNMESPVAYIREGDQGDLIAAYREKGCEIKSHPAGYRSIHYVVSTQPTLRSIHSEIQVRTIFEEGWSEIDHSIRYPNFSDNKLVTYFLTIFNRMSGSADEMGSFVKSLAAEVEFNKSAIADAVNKQEEHLSKIETLVGELEKTKSQSKTKDNDLEKLKLEIKNLRKSTDENSAALTVKGALFSGNLFNSALLASSASSIFNDIIERHGVSLTSAPNIKTPDVKQYLNMDSLYVSPRIEAIVKTTDFSTFPGGSASTEIKPLKIIRTKDENDSSEN